MSISPMDQMRFAGQLATGFRVQHEREFFDLRQRDVTSQLGIDRPWRILDLANGQLQPQYALLQAAGHAVYGIDLINWPQRTWPEQAYRVARWWFRRTAGAPRRPARGLICGNVNRLPYTDQAFDLVTSVAAFEHFLDVPTVIKEAHRILRFGGLLWVSIHLFTSLSGGHNVKLMEIPLRHIPRGVEPWDHLRQRRLPFHVPLNEWRIQQYLTEFARHFDIVKHYCAMREGEDLLTPKIERELAAYTRDELTCGAYVIVARKL